MRSTFLPVNSLFRATVSLSNIYRQIAGAKEKRTSIYLGKQCVFKIIYLSGAASQRFINTIDASTEIDTSIPLDLDRILLIIGNGRQLTQPFQRKTINRFLSRSAVNIRVYLIAPFTGKVIQLIQVMTRLLIQERNETVFEISDKALYFSFLLGATDTSQHNVKTIVVGKRCELRHQLAFQLVRMALTKAAVNDLRHIIKQDFFRATTKVIQCIFNATDKRRSSHLCDKLNITHS